MHDVVIVGVPLIAILAGTLFNNQALTRLETPDWMVASTECKTKSPACAAKCTGSSNSSTGRWASMTRASTICRATAKFSHFSYRTTPLPTVPSQSRINRRRHCASPAQQAKGQTWLRSIAQGSIHVIQNLPVVKVFGTSNERAVKRLLPGVGTISAFEPELQKLTDEELRAKTQDFKARIQAQIEGLTDEEEIVAAEKAALDELLPEAFAVVREAGKRIVNMRHFDVQRLAAWCCTRARSAEIAATARARPSSPRSPAYLNALAGHGVHVVTVNDYLAKRDAEWMGKIYEFFGLTARRHRS